MKKMTTQSDPIVTVNDGRRALRTQLLQTRQQFSGGEKAHLDGMLQTQLAHYLTDYLAQSASKSLRVAWYWPIRGEPDLMPLAHQLLDMGVDVLLPVVVAVHAPLQFGHFSKDMVLKSGAYNIPEPDVQGICLHAPDVVVIPCVGFNDARFRLGYGGGYYDRTLAAWQAAGQVVHTVGVAYAHARVNFELGEFDLPLDVLLTA